MSRLRRAVAAILAASLGALLVASPAAARYDNPEAPTEIDEVRRDLGRLGRATKWRPRRLLTLGTSEGRLGAWVPYEPVSMPSGEARLRVLFNGYSLGPNPGEGANNRMLQVEVRNDCRTASGSTYTTDEWVARSSRTVWYDFSAGEQLSPHFAVDSSTIGCGADAMVGLHVRLALRDGFTLVATSSPIRWHIDNPNRAPEPPDTWDPDFCEATFGPPPWAPGDQGVLWGQPIKIEDTPCLDLQDDWATDFDKVCADPPQATFFERQSDAPFFKIDIGWIPSWIGHYAWCLFYPQGGFDTTPIGEAADGGWMGATRTILGSVAADFGGVGAAGMTTPASGMEAPVMGGVTFADEELARTFLGDAFVDNLNDTQVPASPVAFGATSTTGCGPFVEELPLVGKGVSSCSLAGVWPASFRTAAGALVMITAAFAALFAILRFMGVRYGWQTG